MVVSKILIESGNGIALSIPYSEAEHIFWDAAAPETATQGIEKFFDFLKKEDRGNEWISDIVRNNKEHAEFKVAREIIYDRDSKKFE